LNGPRYRRDGDNSEAPPSTTNIWDAERIKLRTSAVVERTYY